MSKFLHDNNNNAKAIAIPRVFSENSCSNNESSISYLSKVMALVKVFCEEIEKPTGQKLHALYRSIDTRA